jgi:hypothetical protein
MRRGGVRDAGLLLVTHRTGYRVLTGDREPWSPRVPFHVNVFCRPATP